MEQPTVTIEKMVYGGKGLARINGQVVFVPFTLPGEKVRIHITKRHRDYLEGEVIEVIEPSIYRIAPECRYFGRCGGCQISHASYDNQLQTKVSILKETLNRNKITFPEPEVVPGNPFGYRHRAQLKYSARKRQLGFYEMGSNQIADIQQCLCLTPGLNKLLFNLRNELAAIAVPNLSEVECYENEEGETAAYFNAKLPTELKQRLEKITKPFDPEDFEQASLMLKFRDTEFPLQPGIFLQVNPGLWKAMIQEVESHFTSRPNAVIAELYCGAGFFTVAIAPHVKMVYACEENEQAIHFAKTHHNSKNIEWVRSRVEEYRIPPEATVVVVDPPRTGLHKNVISQLLKNKPERITYVSCDPTSLARDLKVLSTMYSIKRIVLLDLFAQTYHFETIALLTLRTPS